MPTSDFLRVAAVSPELRVADCRFNAERIFDQLRLLDDQSVDLAVFPECSLTGYTCGDLFSHSTLLNAAEQSLAWLLESSASAFAGVAVLGLPLLLDGMVFNAAAVIHRGRLLGVVPKSYLPNYKEFYDARYFAPAANAISKELYLAGQRAPFGTDLLFPCSNQSGFVLGVEICEDLWMPVPPSSVQATHGATVFANLSASNETIGKSEYRKQLVAMQSGRCLGGYIYATSGTGESTTDLVFGGHCLIAENGSILAESPRFQSGSHASVADLDLGHCGHDRTQSNSFNDSRRAGEIRREYRRIPFELETRTRTPALIRHIEAHPFVPADPKTLNERCEEIFQTQVCGLAKRLEHIGKPAVSIGVSGGLDSTLALLVTCKAFDRLGVPHSKILGLTLPGFGTSARTLGNARTLMTALGMNAKEIDIRNQCLEQMKALDHAPFGISLHQHSVVSLAIALRELAADNRTDLIFENVQARVRTAMLMNTAFTIGTGDLSESALGWCTYNADQMSMYNPNASIPKTLVRFLVRWAAETEFEAEARKALLDIAATPISPELLPTNAKGEATQETEASIGPYELVDFFLYHFLRWAASPEKILFLASQATFDKPYSPGEIRRWLKVFLGRFFANQFKRSAYPDGPKVGSVSLSPRGDWRMPSDASAKAWLEAVG